MIHKLTLCYNDFLLYNGNQKQRIVNCFSIDYCLYKVSKSSKKINFNKRRLKRLRRIKNYNLKTEQKKLYFYCKKIK